MPTEELSSGSSGLTQPPIARLRYVGLRGITMLLALDRAKEMGPHGPAPHCLRESADSGRQNCSNLILKGFGKYGLGFILFGFGFFLLLFLLMDACKCPIPHSEFPILWRVWTPALESPT